MPITTRRRPTFAALATAVALVAVGGACSDGDRSSGPASAGEGRFPMTVDDCGLTVTLPSEPGAVLTIGTSAVNLLVAAGAGDRIVGRSGEFDSPVSEQAEDEVGDVEILTPDDPSLEQILGAGVDIVVGSGLFGTTPEDLADAGIAHLTVTGDCGHDGTGAESQARLAAVHEDLARFGRVFGTEATAASASADLRARVDAVAASASDREPLSAAGIYFWGTTPTILGAGSIVQEQLDLLGVENVFADVPSSFVEGSVEELIDRDPDVLVLSYGIDGESFAEAREKLLDIPGVAGMRAVVEDRVVPLPRVMRTVDPGAVDGLEHLARELDR